MTVKLSAGVTGSSEQGFEWSAPGQHEVTQVLQQDLNRGTVTLQTFSTWESFFFFSPFQTQRIDKKMTRGTFTGGYSYVYINKF